MQVLETNKKRITHKTFTQNGVIFGGIKKEREQGIWRLELYGTVTSYQDSFVASLQYTKTFRINYGLLNMLEYD